MKLVVGFITYNDSSAKYLDYFLPSLQEALAFLDKSEIAVLAFDNSDPDYNHNRLAIEVFNHRQDGKIEYFSHGENLGFSQAYNYLIERAIKKGAEYFLVINPDLILDPTSLRQLVVALDQDKRLGSVAPKILRWDFANNQKTKQIDSCGIALRAGLKFTDLGQGEIDSGQYNQADILGPSGAAGLYRISALKKVRDEHGYFDKRFFMYKEDCDLAYRLRESGFSSQLMAGAEVFHDRTAAFYGRGIMSFLRNRRAMSKQIRSWSFRNQSLIFVKHYRKETLISRLLVVKNSLSMLFFSLILEKFNLKNYAWLKKQLKY